MSCRVLITGVSGFVGGALGRYLRAAGGYHVTGISRTAAREGAVDDFYAHDLTRPLPADVGSFDVVVHAAALSAPWGSPEAFRAQNVDATRHMLDFVRRTGMPKFLFISSSSVYYRHGDQLGITEETPFSEKPINLYAATKQEAERLVREANVSSVILRPRAVFGPGDTVLFPRILRAAKKGVLPRMQRADGASPQGDLIYIDNLSHYIERAIALPVSGAFNLTNNQPVDLFAFLRDVVARLGLRPAEHAIPVRAAFALAGLLEWGSRTIGGFREPPITRFGVEVMAYSKTFDIGRALAAFGPPPVSLEEGVARFVAWQR
ncbi:MAG TPA: NAD(P)-dependent oxidoreductase [Bryobacteraceae bacterium]|nr:NAD(P)-dependent oxidoreductase [Bryobacteraceae bacterium]